MPTSGSIDFSINRNDLIVEALSVANILAVGETPSANVIDAAAKSLNYMVKSWGTTGPRLWTTQEATLFPIAGQAKYQFGNSSSDHITRSYSSTMLTGAHATLSTTLTVDSTTGMTAGDYIGITLSDASVDWTTISAVLGATTITISGAGLSGEANDDAVVYWYTTKAERALRILQMWRRDINNIDTPLTAISRKEYDGQAAKSTYAVPVEYYYDPQLSAGYLYLWPTPADERDRFVFKFQRTLEDFDAATDTPDFPQEWYEALMYGLAARLAVKFGCPQNVISNLTSMAVAAKSEAEGFDTEKPSLFIQPDMGW